MIEQPNTANTPEWIDKFEAAKRLGMSHRHVLALATDGKLKSEKRSVAGPGGKQVRTLLNAADVDRYAYQMEHPEEFTTAVVPTRHNGAAISAILGEALNVNRAPVPQPLKPWLTLGESAEYSGLPKSVILALINSAQLKAIDCGVREGGRYRVKRSDLDALEGMNC